MKRYTVHLLFHLLALVVGFATGTTAGLWWFGNDMLAFWLAVGALAIGVLVLVLQAVYIAGSPAPPTTRAERARFPGARRQRTGGTLPEMNPVRPELAPRTPTLVQPAESNMRNPSDEDTRTNATEALSQYEATSRSEQ